MKKKLLLAIAFLLISNLLIAQEPLKIEKEKFGHEIYKVSPHPKAEFKVLENGFRYILLPNKTPEKRVLVYLYVDSGSLNETDKQQGLAHFLEHMAFNGSKNFPAGTLIEFFKKLGMNFGGDTNAHTSFDETVYKLNLPEEKFRDDSIKIMADYAMNMLLSPDEIEKEKGVILGEKRARDNIDNRIQDQNFHFNFPNSLIANRQPIGIEETIKSVKQEDFLDYYQTWYRPEAMVLVIVGDITSTEWIKTIESNFNSFQAKGQKRAKPILKDLGHKDIKINYFYEKEAYETVVEINTVVIKNNVEMPFKNLKKVELSEYAATYIFNQRIKEKLSLKDTPYTSGHFKVSDWMNQIKSGSIEVCCKPENWKLSLIDIENELRRALQFGVTNQELALFKKEYVNRLEKDATSSSTVNSNLYMSKILSSISNKKPFQDAIQIKETMKPIVDELTKEDILKEFKKYWAVEHRLIAVNGNAEIKGAELEIKNIFDTATKVEITEQKEDILIPFPFETKPEKSGNIISQEEIKDLQFKRIIFDNNIVLNIKKTDFKKNEINFNLNFGDGMLSLPKGKESMSHLASIAITDGGLSKLSKTQLAKSLTGKNVSTQFSIDSNNFSIQATTTPEDFELNLQLCRAILLYPGFREEAIDSIEKNIDQRYNYINSEIVAYFRNAISKKMTNNNPSLSLLDRKLLEAITLSDLKDWLTTQFVKCPIEINIVGDFDEKKIAEFVSLYFGSLPERQKLSLPNMKTIDLKEKFELKEDYKTTIKKSLVFMTIPTTDYRNNNEILKLNLLGQILNDKTRKLVREKLAISYSPNAGHYANKDFKDYCYFQFTADVSPENAEVAKKAFDSIIIDTAKDGITIEDLEGNRRPLINGIKTNMQTNGYWLNRILSGSFADPMNSKFTLSMLEGYEAISLEQMNETIKKYLKIETRSFYILQAKEEIK